MGVLAVRSDASTTAAPAAAARLAATHSRLPSAGAHATLDTHANVIPPWLDFVSGARRDIDVTRAAAKVLKNSVVVLGGSGLEGSAAANDLARRLGEALGAARLPLRAPDRGGTLQSLVDAARLRGTRRVEALGVGKSGAFAAEQRLSANTREMAKRIMMHQATAYVVMPGDLETLWELMTAWTLMKTHFVPSRPIILVGDPEYWQSQLGPFIHGALADGAIKPGQLDWIWIAETPEAAAELASHAHQRHRNQHHTQLGAVADTMAADLVRGVRLMRDDLHPIVVLGGAGLRPGDAAYETLRACGRADPSAWRTGIGPGAMEAPLRGAREANPEAICEGIGIVLDSEQRINPYVSREHHYVAKTLEIRQRLLFENGRAYLFGSGGIGTYYELVHLLKLMADGVEPARDVLVSAHFRDTIEAFFRQAEALGMSDAQARRFVRYVDDTELIDTIKHLPH